MSSRALAPYFPDNDRDRYFITVDGVDGVGKTSFAIALIQELKKKFEKSKTPIKVLYVSPFGRYFLCSGLSYQLNEYETDRRCESRRVIKETLDNLRDGTVSLGDKVSDEELLKDLFYLSNSSALQAAKEEPSDGKLICVFDRSFATYYAYQCEDKSSNSLMWNDLFSDYDWSIILTDKISAIQKRLSTRKYNDGFDKDNMRRINDLDERFRKLAKERKFDLYDISEYGKSLANFQSALKQIVWIAIRRMFG